MFKCLELFSGTGSFGKVAKDMGYNVLSIDLLLDADIQIDIMDWDYKNYDKNSFDIIWASPPCTEYSRLQDCWINRMRKGKLYTKEQQEINMKESDKLVMKTLEIINYFNPHLWYIENPLGRLKDREIMKNIPYYIIDYCMYSDWGYRKRTCIWTNKKNWKPLICNKKCGNMVGNLHKTNLGNTERRLKTFGDHVDLHKKYRVPPNLIFSLLSE
tara:strand:+ start:22 stop:663 length:642 start_codon:yes stop_codon:yes gene_type:complete